MRAVIAKVVASAAEDKLAAIERAKNPFAFVWLKHGTLSLETVVKAGAAYLGFVHPVNPGDRAAVIAGAPTPIAGQIDWADSIVLLQSNGDVFDFEVGMTYGAQPVTGDPRDAIDDAALARLQADFETWLARVHASHPIAFFVGPIYAEVSEWGQWSEERVEDFVVPYLESFAARNRDTVSVETDRGFDRTALECLIDQLNDYAEPKFQRRMAALIG